MLYQSTRGPETATPLQAVLKGMAGDGGLFVDPDLLSCKFDWLSCLKKAPLPRAAMILSALLPDFEDMPGLVERAYAGKFETPDITPLGTWGTCTCWNCSADPLRRSRMWPCPCCPS